MLYKITTPFVYGCVLKKVNNLIELDKAEYEKYKKNLEEIVEHKPVKPKKKSRKTKAKKLVLTESIKTLE